MKITKSVYILMPISIYLAFLYAPPAKILGDSSRIFYFHVPCSWGAVLAFTVAGIFSIAHLADSKGRFSLLDEKAYNSASIGLLYTILATISGSIWSKISWGSYWNWDPRQTSIAILFLIYIAYFSLYSALKDNQNKGKIAAVYLIFAMITVPFFVFIVPRIYPSLHPDPIINKQQKMQIDSQMRITLLVSVLSFTMLYAYLMGILNRISRLDFKLKEKYDEK